MGGTVFRSLVLLITTSYNIKWDNYDILASIKLTFIAEFYRMSVFPASN